MRAARRAIFTEQPLPIPPDYVLADLARRRTIELDDSQRPRTANECSKA